MAKYKLNPRLMFLILTEPFGGTEKCDTVDVCRIHGVDLDNQQFNEKTDFIDDDVDFPYPFLSYRHGDKIKQPIGFTIGRVKTKLGRVALSQLYDSDPFSLRLLEKAAQGQLFASTGTTNAWYEAKPIGAGDTEHITVWSSPDIALVDVDKTKFDTVPKNFFAKAVPFTPFAELLEWNLDATGIEDLEEGDADGELFAGIDIDGTLASGEPRFRLNETFQELLITLAENIFLEEQNEAMGIKEQFHNFLAWVKSANPQKSAEIEAVQKGLLDSASLTKSCSDEHDKCSCRSNDEGSTDKSAETAIDELAKATAEIAELKKTLEVLQNTAKAQTEKETAENLNLAAQEKATKHLANERFLNGLMEKGVFNPKWYADNRESILDLFDGLENLEPSQIPVEKAVNLDLADKMKEILAQLSTPKNFVSAPEKSAKVAGFNTDPSLSDPTKSLDIDWVKRTKTHSNLIKLEGTN